MTETEKRVRAATEILNGYVESEDGLNFECDTITEKGGERKAQIWLHPVDREIGTLLYAEPFERQYPQDTPEKVADWVSRLLCFASDRLEEFSRRIGKDLHGKKDYG